MARVLATRQLDHGERFTGELSEVTYAFRIESFNVEETSVDEALSKLESATFETLTETLGGDASVELQGITTTKVGKCLVAHVNI